MNNDTYNQKRNDLLQTPDDFARVMEDYFGIYGPELDRFDLERIIFWDFADIENTITLYFENEYDMDKLVEDLNDSPSKNMKYTFDDYNDIDREKITLTITGRMGGLI